MRVAVIGRTEALINTMRLFESQKFEIVCIVTHESAPESQVSMNDFELAAKERNIPFYNTNKIIDIYQDLQNVRADIAISVNYPTIIPEAVCDLFEFGILNAHGGDLPRYRGNACQAWAIINNEKSIGLCIHKMDGDSLDTGDIIERDYIPINDHTKIGHVYDWMFKRIPSMFLAAVSKLKNNPNYFLERQSRDPSLSLRCYPRRPEDARIDWTKSAPEILRLVNASGEPFSCAFCFLENKKIFISDVSVSDHENFLGIPGQISKINDDYVEVLTGNGKIKIEYIDLDGDKIKPIQIIKSIRNRLT